MYYWTATSDDGAYDVRSEKYFQTKKEAYDDMRNAVLEKMKWNTEYDEDFESEDEYINYTVNFSRSSITHESYSGFYSYVILEK